MSSPGGTIYAIGSVGTTQVKIGITTGSVKERLQTLQTGQSRPLQILGQVQVSSGLRHIEKQMHRLLHANHSRGEWFEIAMDQDTLTALVEQAIRRLKDLRPLRGVIAPIPNLARRVKQLRMRAGLSVGELADHANIPSKNIGDIERGTLLDPSIALMAAIARALGVSVDTLIEPPVAAAPIPAPNHPRRHTAASVG